MSSQDSQRIITGAVIGAGIAFLFLTRKGKHLLGSAEPWIDDFIHDIQRVRTASAKLVEAVEEGRRSFDAVARSVQARD